MIAPFPVLTFEQVEQIGNLLRETEIWVVHGFHISLPNGWEIEIRIESKPLAFLEVVVRQHGQQVELPRSIIPRMLKDLEGNTVAESETLTGLVFSSCFPGWHGKWYRVDIWD